MISFGCTDRLRSSGAPVQPNLPCKLAHDAVDGVGIHCPACYLVLAVAAKRAEHRSVNVGRVPGFLKVSADTLRGLRINGKCFVPSAFAYDAQRIIPP